MNSSLNKHVISVDRVSKSFGDLQVLKDISMEIGRGEIVSILGPSGCGKSTLFNIISGLIRPDTGHIELNGSLGYMQQKDLLLPWKTVRENILLPLVIQKLGREAQDKKLKAYLGLVGLEGYEDSYPSELSGGMRQRASFLRTLMASEDILLFDEAFASLDSITKSKMQEWLLQMTEKIGNTLVLITHDIDEALFLSDRIYVLSKKPALIKKELVLNYESEDKLSRRFSKKTLDYKKEILKLL